MANNKDRYNLRSNLKGKKYAKSNMPTADNDPYGLLRILKIDEPKQAAAGASPRRAYMDELEKGIKSRIYTPNAADDSLLNGMKQRNSLFGEKVGQAIGKYSADAAGTYKVQKDMDIGTKSRSDELDAILRARTGDMNVLSGLDEDDPNYALYKRLLRLSGYDDVSRAYGATELPEELTREGVNTYADLFGRQQEYSLNQLGKDLQDVEFLSQGAGDSQRYVDASGRISDYFGGDWSAEAVNERMKAGGAGWYQELLKQYGIDTETLRDAYPLDDKEHDYDGYVQYMQDLAKQKQQQDELMARYEDWKSNFDSKWNWLPGASDYEQYSGEIVDPAMLYPAQVMPDTLTAGYEYMTDDEKRAFSYLYNNPDFGLEGDDGAEQYLKDLQEELWRRRITDKTEKLAEFTDKNALTGALGWVGARVSNLANAAMGAGNAINAPLHALFGKEISPYDPSFNAARYTQTADTVNAQNINEETQWAQIGHLNPFNIIYSGVSSAADSLLSGLAFGPGGGAAAQAFGAGNTELMQGIEAGDRSFADVVMDAIATGAFEGLTEKFSMDALFKGGTSGVKNIVRNMITEPSEEIMNMLLNLGYDRARYGTDDALGTRMSELRTQGYTEPEARVQLLMELGGEALETALTAWVTGATSGTVSAVTTHAENKNIGKQIQENETTSPLLEIAEGLQGMPEDVRAMIEDQKAALLATFRKAFDSEQETAVSEAQSEETVEAEPEATEAEPEATEEPRKVIKKVTETAEQLRRKALEKQDAFQAAMDAVARKFGSAEDAIKAANEMREAQEAADRAEAAEAAEDSSVAPDEVTEYAQEETEEVLPDLASDVARNSTNEAAPEAAPEAVREAEKEVLSEAAPEVESNDSNEAVPEAAPEAAEETTETAEKAAPKRPDTKKKKTPKLNDAKLGRIYRETMSRLDEQAQALVEGNFAETSVRKALQKYSFLDTDTQGRVAQRDKPMQQLLEKVTAKAIYSAEKLTEQERSVLLGSKAAMRAVGEFTGIVPRDGDTERKRIRSAAEELYSLAQPKSKTAAEAVETSETGAAAEPQDVSVTVDEASELTPAEAEQVVNEVASAYGSNADIVSGAYEQGQNVAEYATAFRTAYEYGQDGRNLENIKTSSALAVLNDNQIRTAYELGRGVRRTATMPGQKQYRGVSVGNVDTSALKGMKLNGTQQKSVGAIRRLAEAVGFNVEFIASTPNAEGKYTTKNGSWNSSTRTMTVDINAGRISAGDANYAMMQTVGHELTHFIADFADSELFNDYQEFVFGHLSEKMDEDVLNDRIRKIIEGNAKQGKTLTREQAAIEVVADASGDALLSLTEADIRELAQTRPTLLQKIADYIQKWTKKVVELIRKAYDGQGRNSISEQMVDVAEEMGRKWVALLKDANARTTHTEVYEAQKAEQTQERQNQATTLRQQDGNFLAYNHIDQRTAETVRSVDTQLFCSEVEEATLYYAAAANMLLHDVEGSVSGQKFFTGDGEVTGQKRMTSDFIAGVKDSTGWTWEKIRNSLEQFAAMESGEQLPKNTVTNREMELYLDEVLSNGYTTTEGVKVAPADDYVAAKAQYRGSAGNAAPRSAYEGAVDFMEYAFGDVAYSVRESGKVYKYTEDEYNTFAWATSNGILTRAEVDEIERINGERNGGGKTNETTSADGFKVNEIGKPGKVHDLVVVTDTNFGGPDIQRVYRVNSEYEDVIDIIRKDVRENEETYGSDAVEFIQLYYSNELVKCYSKKDFIHLFDPETGRPRRTGSAGREMDREAGGLHNREGSAEDAGRDGAVNARGDLFLQLRDPDLISDREILANIMDSAAANADELDHVRRYRKRMDTLNQLQTDLDATNAAIADARKRGAKAEQAALQEKANGIAKKLDREDGMLLKFESGKLLQAVVERQRTQLRKRLNEQASRRARERVKEVRQKDREHYEERIRQLRAEKNAKLDELRREKTDAVAKVRAEKNESFARAQYLGEVQKHAKRLMDMLTTPTNKAHVPEFLRRPLGDFITALDFSSVTKLKGGSDTKGDERLKDAMSDLATALRRVHNQQFGDQTTGAEFFGGYLDLPGDFLDTFDELMAKIRVSLKTSPAFAATPVNKMTSEQLHDLAKVFRLLHSSIANMNRLISNAKYASAVTAANDTMTDLEAIRDKRSHSELAQKVSSFLDWKNTVPYYVFKRFGRGGMAIFEGLMDGWDKLAHNSDELVKFTDKAYNVSEVREWEREVHAVELASGNTVSMTTAQMMSVYCLAKREQARGHLLGGGIRVADIGSRGKVIRQVANHLLTDADLKAIAKQLTPRQREVADALQGYMSSVGSEWGNYVSMKRFGYEMFTEEHYFPIETDPNNRAAQDEKSEGESLYRLLNMSATKGLTKGANNAIVVRSIFDVFTAHMTDMAKYNALGLQLLDTFKWFNYVERTQNKDGTVETRTTQKALEEAYGGDARSYIMQFLRDLNGVSEGGREDGFINKATSNYKIASTAANLRVGILQITSMPRAAYVINPKYLAVGLAKWNTSRGKNSAKAAEEVGIAKWKSMGFYDTNINRSVRKMVKHDENWREKAQGWSTKLAEWGDAWTMGVLYGAVEAEMKDKHPSVQPGSKAYRELFNRRMREIVYQTQVVDSTMTRSQLMRSKGLITLATSFMSEPTLAMNMLNDAIFEARVKARAGKAWFPAAAPKVARAFGTTTFVIGLSSVIEALFTAYRDDDEFETFAEKLTKAFFGESFWDGALGGNLNLLNNLPLIKDVIAAAQGDTSDAMYSAWAKTMYDGLKTLYTVMAEGGSDADIYRGVYKTVNGMSQLTGIAAGGAMRELVALYNTFVAEPYGWKRLQTYENTAKDAAKAIYAAALRGDTDMVKFYRERASMYGLDAEKISKALATLVEADLNAGNIDSAAARRLLTGEAGKTADYAADLINDVEYEKATGLDFDNLRDDYAAGLLTESQVRSHLTKYGGLDSDEVEDKMSRYDYYIATGKTTTPPKYWRIAYAHETGGNYRKLAEDAIVDIIAGGRTEKQARRQIADSLESYYKANYLAVEGTPAGDRMLEDILDVYEAIGYTRDYERNYIAENWFD